MKMNLNILFLVVIAGAQLHASQPATPTPAAKSNAMDADWDFLSDNASPIQKILWKNAVLGVIAQMRVAQIEKLKAENQLKDSQAKQLQDELAQANSGKEMLSEIACSNHKASQFAQEKQQEESAANQKQLTYIRAVHSGYKKTAIQQLAALQEKNLKLNEELEQVKICFKQRLIEFQKTNDEVIEAALERLSSRLSLDIQQARLSVLHEISPLLSVSARKEISAIAARLS